MIQKIINIFKSLDKQVKNLIIKGLYFSLLFCSLSTCILLIYHFYLYPTFYLVGTILLKTSFMFFADFIILGVGFDKIKKQMA